MYVRQIHGMYGLLKLRQAEMARGLRSRTTSATLLNASSSRSHAGITLHVRQRRLLPEGGEEVLETKLHLVDLAGQPGPGYLITILLQHRTGCSLHHRAFLLQPGSSDCMSRLHRHAPLHGMSHHLQSNPYPAKVPISDNAHACMLHERAWCDAGSERRDRSGAVGQQLAEATSINSGLFHLREVQQPT